MARKVKQKKGVFTRLRETMKPEPKEKKGIDVMTVRTQKGKAVKLRTAKGKRTYRLYHKGVKPDIIEPGGRKRAPRKRRK